MRSCFVFLFLCFITINSIACDSTSTIHIFVALCDNENQGIVSVPAILGNGTDPGNNLYWGAAYGVKTYFDKKSDNWTRVKTIKNPKQSILERIVFKHTESETYLVADAYNGAKIKTSISHFLHASSGQHHDSIKLNNKTLLIGGHSDLIAYIGHNGLMDFEINEKYRVNKQKSRDIIILACYSQRYFTPYMKAFNTNPLVWSTGLMSAEAYTLKWAIDGWLKNESNEQIVTRARKAYNHYQQCGMKGASNLLQTGF
jgi:hypothetical protein